MQDSTRTPWAGIGWRVGLVALAVGSLLVTGCDNFDFFTVLDGDDHISLKRPLAINATELKLYVNESFSFAASGGTPPYSFSVVDGAGSIDAESGSYVAPPTPGSETVRVTDAKARTAGAHITVLEQIHFSLSPTAVTLGANASITFAASGGTTPYSYSVTAGSGTIDEQTGLYTAPGFASQDTVHATDAGGSSAEATVTVLEQVPFSLSPTAVTLGANASITFVASGGTTPYSYSVTAGSGTIDEQTGLYTAPGFASQDTVRATDAGGNSAEATVTVLTTQGLALTISPLEITVYVNSSVNFDAFGGSPPYAFSLVSGSGSIDGCTGLYVAPSDAETDVVRVTDDSGDTSDATVAAYAFFVISPSSLQLTVGSTFVFTASGGLEPYSFSMRSGTGTVDPATGLYTTPAAPDNDVVEARDALGNTSSAAVVVTLPAPLTISPAAVTLNVNSVTVFSATGGQAPYTYSVQTGSGSIGATTGVYTAPPGPEAGAVVRVTDDLGTTSDASVTVVGAGPLTISPASGTVSQTQSLAFSASGGTPPYSYTVTSGGGTINSSTGVYTAPAAIGAATTRVTDSLAAFSEASVGIAPLPPSNLVADGSAGGPQLIRLTWLDAATGEEGFSIERKESTTEFAEIASPGPDSTTFDDDGLIPNMVYIYRVRAYAGAAFSAYSDIAFAIPNS